MTTSHSRRPSRAVGRGVGCAAMDDFTTANELAASLKIDPKYLRHLIRRHRLVPAHPKHARYELDADDVARISEHPAVRQASENRR